MYIYDLKFSVYVHKVLIQGTVSQISNLCLSFILCQKTGNFLTLYLKLFFLDFIK